MGMFACINILLSLPVLVLQESSSSAVSKEGRMSLTPWALSLLITALAVSSAAYRHITYRQYLFKYNNSSHCTTSWILPNLL